MSDMPDLNSESIASLISKLTQSTPPTEADTQAQEAKPVGNDLFSSLLSNPEIISKLPQIMSMVKPLMESMSSTQTKSAFAPAPSEASTDSENLKPPVKQIPFDNRTTLLYAMKPYLGQNRKDAIDHIVKLSKLGDILKNL